MAARPRYLAAQVRRDLAQKMVLVAGPRQVGKTTLARSLPGAAGALPGGVYNFGGGNTLSTYETAGKVLASPKLYRAAVEGVTAASEYLPRFMLYSRFNAWGRQRDVPVAPQQTFRQWYLKNRGEQS